MHAGIKVKHLFFFMPAGRPKKFAHFRAHVHCFELSIPEVFALPLIGHAAGRPCKRSVAVNALPGHHCRRVAFIIPPPPKPPAPMGRGVFPVRAATRHVRDHPTPPTPPPRQGGGGSGVIIRRLIPDPAATSTRKLRTAPQAPPCQVCYRSPVPGCYATPHGTGC